MSRQNDVASDSSERELVIMRILNAPREVVFKAWTDPKQVVRWWGPKGFTKPTVSPAATSASPARGGCGAAVRRATSQPIGQTSSADRNSPTHPASRP